MIKNRIIIALAVIVLICGTLLHFSYNHSKALDKSLKITTNNLKAEVNKNIIYQYTLNDLKSSKDSEDIKVLEMARQLKIQPKKIVETVYIESEFVKKDTVNTIDSVFIKDYNAKIGDDWYSLELQFKAPDQISTDLKVKNEIVAITYDRKETVKPPYKLFL